MFHTKVHYSSSQLTCWFERDPFCYEKFVREEVLEEGFLDRFPNTDHAGRLPVLDAHDLERLVKEFERLRLTDETINLRNAAVNIINGMTNMSFSCDGTHYIDHQTFLAKLDNFETIYIKIAVVPPARQASCSPASSGSDIHWNRFATA